MAKYNVQIEFPGSGKELYQELSTALKSETNKNFRLSPAKETSHSSKAEYAVEGSISLPDLGKLLSRVSAKINLGFILYAK